MYTNGKHRCAGAAYTYASRMLRTYKDVTRIDVSRWALIEHDQEFDIDIYDWTYVKTITRTAQLELGA